MSISVVTVALNAAKDLPLTIESVRQQDYDQIEFIVVDGGSHDGTATVLERYTDVIDQIVHTEDAGIYHAMNIALDYCHGEYVLFLNAKDTLFSATALSRLMACKRPDADVFFGNHVYVDGGREYLKKSSHFGEAARQLSHGQIDHTWLARRPGHQATFVRTSLLRTLRFDTRIELCADHDLLMRAYTAGAAFQYIDQTVSHYYGGGLSAQRTSRVMLEWCSIYREYSTVPDTVDKFFLGDARSPFGSQNTMLGSFVTGDYPCWEVLSEHGALRPVKWCRPDGLRLRTPAHGPSSALRLRGFNRSQRQSLTLFHAADIIATINLEVGWFDATVVFMYEIPPCTIVEVVAFLSSEIADHDRRNVSFALAAFGFEVRRDVDVLSDSGVLNVGDVVPFTARNRVVTQFMLGTGWSVQEEEHLWTVGETAELRFCLAPDVQELVLYCLGNPFVTDAQERGARFEIDGRDVGPRLLGTEINEVILHCPSAQRDAVTKLKLRPFVRRGDSNDNRTLGVCLVSMACR